MEFELHEFLHVENDSTEILVRWGTWKSYFSSLPVISFLRNMHMSGFLSTNGSFMGLVWLFLTWLLKEKFVIESELYYMENFYSVFFRCVGSAVKNSEITELNVHLTQIWLKRHCN